MSMPPSRYYFVAIAAAGAVLGCGLLGSSDYPVAVEILAQGPSSQGLASPVVRVLPGEAVVEVEEGFSDPGYRIRATGRSEDNSGASAPRTLLIEVETDKLGGTFPAMVIFRNYRLTVSSLPPGTYALRLHWQNDFRPPQSRSRMLVDTVVTIP